MGASRARNHMHKILYGFARRARWIFQFSNFIQKYTKSLVALVRLSTNKKEKKSDANNGRICNCQYYFYLIRFFFILSSFRYFSMGRILISNHVFAFTQLWVPIMRTQSQYLVIPHTYMLWKATHCIAIEWGFSLAVFFYFYRRNCWQNSDSIYHFHCSRNCAR